MYERLNRNHHSLPVAGTAIRRDGSPLRHPRAVAGGEMKRALRLCSFTRGMRRGLRRHRQNLVVVTR